MSALLHPRSLVCQGRIYQLDSPWVMGIVNVTPDSFFDGGRYHTPDTTIARARAHVQAGARILDLGGYSTRPGAPQVRAEEEVERLLPAVKALKAQFPDVLLSIDTFRAEVAEACLHAGADIINDISGGVQDDKMFEVVARYRAPYILMHMRGTPQNMQQNCEYPNGLTVEINQFFSRQIALARQAGVNDILLDPGFGFSKTLEQNYELMHNLPELGMHELPILVGISRKSMLYKALGGTPETSLNATTFLNAIALQKGAAILRVHDVQEAMECVRLQALLEG